MLKSIAHTAFLAQDIQRALAGFEQIGFSCERIADHPEVGLRIAFLAKGDTRLELLQVIDASSPAASDMPGLHHVAFAVDDIEEAWRVMRINERYRVTSAVRQGAEGRIFFFEVDGLPGARFECQEDATSRMRSPR